MKFTYESYKNLIKTIKERKYTIANYHNYSNYNKCVILRHDVDNSLEKALYMAKLEKELKVQSTYFIMTSTEFYNLLSKKSLEVIGQITKLGHEIGLHFDEEKYSDYKTRMNILIEKETRLLEEMIQQPIRTVSMHRPSKETLSSNYQFDSLINSYDKEFFYNFKYVSDSRRNWREDILDYIMSEKYQRMQILTHPFWYNKNEVSLEETIKVFVNSANYERYINLNDNIRDLESIMKESEILSYKGAGD